MLVFNGLTETVVFAHIKLSVDLYLPVHLCVCMYKYIYIYIIMHTYMHTLH